MWTAGAHVVRRLTQVAECEGDKALPPSPVLRKVEVWGI
ncbi:MAG: hypothetical protein QOF58_7390 [Pseudonocardiales bacterium]|jgi:hypothetical protein|nr:hypothetical protein [Pseudonocardiales bacterium]